jgi:hypothetical protein
LALLPNLAAGGAGACIVNVASSAHIRSGLDCVDCLEPPHNEPDADLQQYAHSKVSLVVPLCLSERSVSRAT